MRKPLIRSWSGACSRLLVLLAIQLVSIPTGCADSPPPSAAVAPQPPPPAASPAPADAPPPPPPPAPPPSAPGYAPMAAASAAPQNVPATFRQPATPTHAGSSKTPPPAGKPAPQPGRAAGRGERGPAPVAASTAAPAPAGPAAPLLVYVGNLAMQVEDTEIAATLDRIIDLAESLGGYLAGRKDGSVEVRIPSPRFREGLTGIEKFGEVLHRSVTADDVSEQYNDLEVRLVNLKATRQRLQEFLGRAQNVAEALQVAGELERVAGQMEQVEGKMRFLRSRAAFSLVTVTVTARPKPIVKVVETPVTPPPREVDLPIDWLTRVGLGRLLNLRSP